MNAQLINFGSDFAWKYYANKFGVNPELRKFDSLGLLLKGTETLFFRPKFSANFFRLENEILIVGNFKELVDFSFELSANNSDWGNLAESVLSNYENFDDGIISIAGKNFSLNQPHIMGILNVTPDSFSDGGNYFDKDKAIEHALQMIKEGAEIIDVGGESTRPGADAVPVEEELERVIPVITAIKAKEPQTVISIDTTKSKVAEEAIKAGASIVNDISGFSFDEQILEVVKKYNVTYILMHIKGTPRTMQKNPEYEEPVSEIYDFLTQKISRLIDLGIGKIIIDPGIGFGKRFFDNYEIINRLDEFKGLGFPILIGLSRKSFLGNSLGLKIDERDTITSVAEAISVSKGARFIRTHNVANASVMKNFINYLSNTESLL